ncbi:MAG TPA: squalene/phytoene synthase family protein, partial [Chthoniobacterales bacterium]|nr:squalene/phytoene synthase family protein [Chthoniobacterales bacterium]
NGGRIYLPLNELKMFGYSAEALQNRTYNSEFLRLMQFQAERAHSFFREAERLLPREDRRSMVAAEGMRAIYHALLRKIERDRFRLFDKRYQLSRLEKGMLVGGQIALKTIF